jgi:hypothetical protein
MPRIEQDVIETYRAAVLARVERTSLRQAAREIGLSPSGLQKFIDGAQPYRNTIRKLEAWYVRRTERDSGNHSPGTVAVAVHILGSLSPIETRDTFVERLMGHLESVLPAEERWRAEFVEHAPYMRS